MKVIVHSENETDLLAALARIVTEKKFCLFTWFGFAEVNEARTVRCAAYAGSAGCVPETQGCRWGEIGGGGPVGQSVTTRCVVSVDDATQESGWNTLGADAQARGFRSVLVLPLVVDGVAVGAWAWYAAQPGFYDDAVVKELRSLADDLAHRLVFFRTSADLARAERASVVLQQRLMSIVEFLPDATFVIDQDKRVVAWNRACELLTGFTKETVLGRGDYIYAEAFLGKRRPILVDQLDLEEWNVEPDYFSALRRVGNTVTGEAYNTWLQGGRGLYLWGTAAPLFDPDGNRCGAIQVVRDMTEKKRLESALREGEVKYRELVEYANSIILRWNSNGCITFLNEYGLKFFGFSAEEIFGRHVLDTIVPASDSEGRDLRALMEQICANPRDFERNINENVRRDGQRVWIAWTNRIVRDDRGQAVEILSVGTDITEQKRAEEALRRREEQFRMIMENIADLVAVLDLDGRRIYNSPSYRLAFGDPQDIAGTCAFDQIHPEDRERVKRTFGEAVRSGKDFFIDFRMMDLKGQTRYLESQANLIRDANGKVIQVAAVSREITERKRAEEAIRELNASLERRVSERTAELAVALERSEAADRLKSAFLATMSHELRTPLNSIIGFTGIILQGLAGPLNPEQRKQLEMVRNSARHLLALINDVLDISKIEAGQLVVVVERCDVRASIIKSVEIVRPLAEKKGLKLELSLTDDIGVIESDPRRLEQILLNLLNNAIKFTAQGGVALQASVSGVTVQIAIKDTGIGIKPGDMSQLFQPFRQIDSGLARQHEGTGLGLAICSRLAGLLGGEIQVESVYGQGSVFTLRLYAKKLEVQS
jgi:PAS domain S-box-containing protein